MMKKNGFTLIELLAIIVILAIIAVITVPTRNDNYIAYVDNSGTKTAIFTVSYSGKKARLTTAQEVAEITGASSTTSPGISWNEQNTTSEWFYLDSKNQSTFSSMSSYYWLFENLKDCAFYGCVNQYQDISSGNSGYWTSSPFFDNSSNAWSVHSFGRLDPFHSVADTNYGIRPVITVSNS